MANKFTAPAQVDPNYRTIVDIVDIDGVTWQSVGKLEIKEDSVANQFTVPAQVDPNYRTIVDISGETSGREF